MLKNKKFIIIAIVVVVFAIIIFILYQRSKSNQVEGPNKTGGTSPEQEEVIPPLEGKDVAIYTTSPTNNYPAVLPSDPIQIQFQEPLPPSQQALVTYNVNPTTRVTDSWQDNQILIITPQELLIHDQQYLVTIFYKGSPIYSFTFNTVENKLLSDEQTSEVLERGEKLYNQAIKEDIKVSPWKAVFPIITDNYTMIYAPNKDVFIVDFLRPYSGEQLNLYKEEIRLTLDSIDAPQKKIEYLYK